jgi:hypothetical protein
MATNDELMAFLELIAGCEPCDRSPDVPGANSHNEWTNNRGPVNSADLAVIRPQYRGLQSTDSLGEAIGRSGRVATSEDVLLPAAGPILLFDGRHHLELHQ